MSGDKGDKADYGNPIKEYPCGTAGGRKRRY